MKYRINVRYEASGVRTDTLKDPTVALAFVIEFHVGATKKFAWSSSYGFVNRAIFCGQHLLAVIGQRRLELMTRRLVHTSGKLTHRRGP